MFQINGLFSDSDAEHQNQCENPTETATITGIYLNKSSGLSGLFKDFLATKEEVQINDSCGAEVKIETDSNENYGYPSNGESENSDINDLNAVHSTIKKEKVNIKILLLIFKQKKNFCNLMFYL